MHRSNAIVQNCRSLCLRPAVKCFSILHPSFPALFLGDCQQLSWVSEKRTRFYAVELLPSAFVERKILRRIQKENRWTKNGPWNTPAEWNHCSNPRQAQPTCFQRYLSCPASLWINEFGAFERIFQRRPSRALPLLWCSVSFVQKQRN